MALDQHLRWGKATPSAQSPHYNFVDARSQKQTTSAKTTTPCMQKRTSKQVKQAKVKKNQQKLRKALKKLKQKKIFIICWLTAAHILFFLFSFLHTVEVPLDPRHPRFAHDCLKKTKKMFHSRAVHVQRRAPGCICGRETKENVEL